MYELPDQFPFIYLIAPNDPWTSPFKLYVHTSDWNQLGVYYVHLIASLLDYPSVAPVELEFAVTITDKPNNLPYFDPKLPASATILMTRKPESWSL